MIDNEEKVLAFDQEHDRGDGSVTTETGRVLFSDGAQRSVQPFGIIGFEFGQPSADPKRLVALQKQFWTLRLAELVEQFEDLRHRCQTLAKSDGSRFQERLAELRTLQTKIRSARSKLAHLATLQRGYCQADISRAWEVWNAFSQAASEESRTAEKFHSAMRGKSSPGVLEKLKRAYDLAKKQSERAMERLNDFQPSEARTIVAEELDLDYRQRQESELEQVEI